MYEVGRTGWLTEGEGAGIGIFICLSVYVLGTSKVISG